VGTQFILRAVLRDSEAIDRTYVDAGIALDAQFRREYGLNVAIQAALNFEFHFDVDILEALDERDMRH
jgi:hypothetical protein